MQKKPRRSGVEECFRYLGEVGALIFFCRAALHPEAAGKDLLDWTLRLQKALLAQKKAYAVNQDVQAEGVPLRALKIDTPQISTWRRDNPIIWAMPTEARGALAFRMLAVDVIQATEPSRKPSWQGHLLIVFEPNTNTLVHRFLKVNRSAELSSDWILYVLAKADQIVRKRAVSQRVSQESVSIALPGLGSSAPSLAGSYAEAGDRLRSVGPAGALHVTWRGRFEADLFMHGGSLDEAGPRSGSAELTFESSRSFSNALIRASRAFNVQDGTDSATWAALNPLKGEIDRKPGWEEQERLRRLALRSSECLRKA